MSVQPLTWDDFEDGQQLGPERTVLFGWRLWSARVLWVLVMLVTVGLFVASIKPYFEFVLFFPKFWFSSPDFAPALEQLSLTAGFYHGYLIVLQGLQVVVCLVIAALIFKNKSDDWLALFVSLTLVAFAASQGDQIGALLMNVPALRYAAMPSLALAETALLLLLYFFPDGDCSPNWTKPLAWLWVLWQISNLVYEASPLNPALWPALTRNLVMLAWFSTGLFAQIWSYVKDFSPVERQQTKWVLFGFVLSVVGMYVPGVLKGVIPALGSPGLGAVVYDIAVVEGFARLAFLLIPVALMVSIMRFGLWEVDSLINRALVYGGLTIVMVILFELLSGLIENLSEMIVAEPPGIIEAITALAIGALIQPVQDRVQDFVDARFYAAKVDLGNAIRTFSDQISDVIDRQELLRLLLDRTIELLQIGHGGVYVRDSERTMTAAETQNIADERFKSIPLSGEVFAELERGDPVFEGDDTFQTLHPGMRQTFQMLVPLTVVNEGVRELSGVLALGPRLSGMGYSREDETLMTTLAESVSRALRVAELIEQTRRYEQTPT
jgi:hypothetical protein